MRDTRTEILAEAELLIRGRGYSGMSYADLADGIGIRKASIHHHFPTKADLAVALLAAYDARYDMLMDEICAGSDNALVRIEGYAKLYMGGVEKGLGCLCAAFTTELATLPDRLRTDLTAFFKKHVAWIETVLAAGRDNGSVRADVDPAPYARMIVASLEGGLMMERVLDGPIGFTRVVTAIQDALRPA